MRIGLIALALAVAAGAGAPALHTAAPLAGGGSLVAQDRPDEERRELAERVRERFYHKAAKSLELSDAEVDELRSVLREFREPRVELHRDRRALRREKRGLEDAESSEDLARELVERRAELRTRETEIEREEEQRLMELLGPARLLEFQDLRERFNQRVQKIRICEDYRDGRSRR